MGKLKFSKTSLSFWFLVGLVVAALVWDRVGGSQVKFVDIVSKSVKGETGPMGAGFDKGIGWINSEPLVLSEVLADPKTRAVLVDFWTYTCINCQRTLPFVRSWWDKYKDDGLVIVGVHTPEFEFEKEKANVLEAVKKYGVGWPVVQDNDYGIWSDYGNHYWPRKYLLNKQGEIVYDHIGEGAYEETERQIQKLLAVEESITEEESSKLPRFGSPLTPEIYAGLARGVFGNVGRLSGGTGIFEDPEKYERDRLYFVGSWHLTDEQAWHARESEKPFDDKVVLRFGAKNVFLVMRNGGSEPYRVYLTLDGQSLTAENRGEDVQVDESGSYVIVDEDDLYRLVSLAEFGEHVLQLGSVSDKFELFAFTFGS